jgi:hypothetical protein
MKVFELGTVEGVTNEHAQLYRCSTMKGDVV